MHRQFHQTATVVDYRTPVGFIPIGKLLMTRNSITFVTTVGPEVAAQEPKPMAIMPDFPHIELQVCHSTARGEVCK